MRKISFLVIKQSLDISNDDLITGKKAKVSGYYQYDGPIEGKNVRCAPTPEEQVIPLDQGDTAPPVKSCGDSAKWKFLRRK